jgi:hemerythrin superfamily protein
MKNTQKSKAKKTPAKAAAKASVKASVKAQPTKGKASAKSGKQQASKGQDIIQLILADHKPLKKLIKIMKDSDKHDLSERQDAFEEFAPLLISHAKPEEQTMYVFMKDDEDLREEGFEGDVEHGLADQMVEEIKRTDDEDLWSARVKVLAELVEHHIEEEEEELLPDFKKHSEPTERIELGAAFLRLKKQLEAQGGKDTTEETMADEEITEDTETEEELRASH